ncbi:MAG TPA: ionic transporter y4hA [Candidatus Eisenbacteria bacterium]|nr:ionic transporter y4hA [Candidatus Eisenbacteria bacterium]
MVLTDSTRTPWWSWTWPVVGLLILVVHFVAGPGIVLQAAEAFALVATVFAAVFHAEIIALRVGEPFGTLVLALAVTTIEVALIVSMMIGGGAETASLARDTLFAAVMIVCNGIIGICLLAGGMRHREQGFQLLGANAALTVLIGLTTLTLVLPNVTITTVGPTFSRSQLAFAAAVSLVLYGAFVFVQTVRHRDYFLPAGGDGVEEHALPPPNKVALTSSALLLASLVIVVALAKALTPAIEGAIDAVGAPKSVVGIIIAALVLLPEGLASYRAAVANRLQTSVNLALGSALASLGLTIPAVAGISLFLGKPLTLGLNPKEELLLAVTLVVSILTLGTGRTTVLQGVVHIIIFAVFLFLAVAP